MEDATKALTYLRPGVGRPADPATTDESADTKSVGDARSTGEKALDRWFLEERGGRKVPKRLELPNEALITSGGPIRMTGNITLIDEEGKVTHGNQFSFCRCGSTRTGPVCDSSHMEAEFLDNGSIRQASDCLPLKRPQTVTVTCVKNGPLKFRGYLRIYNRKGQECATMQGALCRCGRSAKKPFCDCC